jgi:hypothetical protein
MGAALLAINSGHIIPSLQHRAVFAGNVGKSLAWSMTLDSMPVSHPDYQHFRRTQPDGAPWTAGGRLTF